MDQGTRQAVHRWTTIPKIGLLLYDARSSSLLAGEAPRPFDHHATRDGCAFRFGTLFSCIFVLICFLTFMNKIYRSFSERVAKVAL